jgi:hypothetical protein
LSLILGEGDAGSAGEQQRSEQGESSETSIHNATSPFGWLISLRFDSKDAISPHRASPSDGVTGFRKLFFFLAALG